MAFVRRRPPEPCSTSLSQLAEECLPLLARLLSQQLVLTSRLGPELWPVRADRVQLEQVLLNLLINARDAMPDGGEVTVAAANVEAGPAEGVPPGEYVRLSVIDTGPGLSPELLERLFTPFVTAGPRGVGLGLFSCYLVVHQLGGAIQVESAPGCGTTFQIYLPRAED
jgi:signal transduction histidine kinase